MNETELFNYERQEKLLITDKLIQIHDNYSRNNVCAIHAASYWAYEFCFNGAFDQYHYFRDATIKDVDGPIYTLGRNPIAEKDQDFEIVRNDLLGTDGSAYISQLIGNGDICDITLKPRSTFIHYKCGKGLKAPVIESVSELRTCQYQVDILLPELCDLDIFQPRQTLTYKFKCQALTKEGEIPKKINLVEYKVYPLGFNLFVGALKSSEGSMSVLFTNKMGPLNYDRLRTDIIRGFVNSVETHRLHVPPYWVKTFTEDQGSASTFFLRPNPTLINDNDKFIYITKLFDVNGNFIDNVEIYFDKNVNHSVTFGLEMIGEADNADDTSREWYGTDVEPDEKLMGNFIMFNGIRMKGV